MAKSILRQQVACVRSQQFNIDNGSGTTIDEIMVVAPANKSIKLTRVYCIYQEVTQTVAAGNFMVGVAAGGATIVASTAYGNAAAMGSITNGVLLTDNVAPGTAVWVRHTGVAVTQTGLAQICIEYVINE